MSFTTSSAIMPTSSVMQSFRTRVFQVHFRLCTASLSQFSRLQRLGTPKRTFSSAGFGDDASLCPFASAVPPRILVTGATGQIGSELVPFLREKYGEKNVVASDIRPPPSGYSKGPFEVLDVMNEPQLRGVFEGYEISWIIHLASMLSAVGEKNPNLAMKLNARGIEHVLELARTAKHTSGVRVFAPSTIAAFGPSTPRDNVPDLTIMRPTTIYGVTKVYLELLGEYYHRKFGVDFRSVRYPGIISAMAPPGGGTTDYAVEMYHEAAKSEFMPAGHTFKCFLSADSALPMMYMPDCLEATVQLLETPKEKLKARVYNVQGMSFTPDQEYAVVKKYAPNLAITYAPDFRQQIADSWPRSLDDSNARADWNFKPKYDLDAMTRHMLAALRTQYMPKNDSTSASASVSFAAKEAKLHA